jgi:hypothetical protein
MVTAFGGGRCDCELVIAPDASPTSVDLGIFVFHIKLYKGGVHLLRSCTYVMGYEALHTEGQLLTRPT